MAGELAAEWIKIPDGNGNLQKVWVRDSTARRDIAQLQTDVSGLVIPDPSDASPQMDGTAAAGSSADYSRADHVHPSDTSKADAATTLAGYGITDAYTKTQVDGMIPSVPSAYTSNPEMDGTASPGSSTAWARGDHVHPSDTSKQDAATTGTLTLNNTSYTRTYMDSASGSWERIGNIVVFNLTYKMKSSISSHLTGVILGFPNCPIIAHFLSESEANEVAARHVTVSGNSGTIAGAHSGGTTYYAAGAYLTA